MKYYAVRIFDKKDVEMKFELIQVVEAATKLKARLSVIKSMGHEYRVGQVYLTDQVVGRYIITPNTYTVIKDYTNDEIHNIKKSIDDLKAEQAEEKNRAWYEKYPDGAPVNKTSGLPTLQWHKIAMGSKYDRYHTDEHGNEITRKEWKRKRKAALAS